MTYRKDVLEFGAPDALAAGEMMSALLAQGHKLQAAWKSYDAALASVSGLLQGRGAGRAQACVSPLEALAHAVSQLGVIEDQPGSNGGEEVDGYLRSVGLEGGYAWRTAFVHWCFQAAADDALAANPFPRTAGSLEAWNMTDPSRRISRAKAMLNPELIRPGLVFVLDLGGGAGHAGFVRRVSNGALTTVECALDPSGGDGAFGVFELSRRRIADRTLRGFLDFG